MVRSKGEGKTGVAGATVALLGGALALACASDASGGGSPHAGQKDGSVDASSPVDTSMHVDGGIHMKDVASHPIVVPTRDARVPDAGTPHGTDARAPDAAMRSATPANRDHCPDAGTSQDHFGPGRDDGALCDHGTWKAYYPDLRGCDFRDAAFGGCFHQDCEKVDFRNADLRGADFHGAYFNTAVDIRGADLLGADLSGAAIGDLKGCPARLPSCAWACLTQQAPSEPDAGNGAFVVLGPTVAVVSPLDGLDLSGLDLSQATLSSSAMSLIACPAKMPATWRCIPGPASGRHTIAGPGVWLNGDLSHMSFAGLDLAGARIEATSLVDVDLSNSDLSGAVISARDLTGTNLTGATLNGASVGSPNGCPSKEPDARYECRSLPAGGFLVLGPGVDISGAWLGGGSPAEGNTMHLDHVDLEGARIVGTVVSYVSLVGANLKSANLMSSDLTESDLTDALLDGADLRYANLTNANFTGASMVGADLTGATITGANFSNVKR